MVDNDDDQHKVMQQSLVRLRRKADAMSMDQVVALKLIVKTYYDALTGVENSKRVCPGRYWRIGSSVPKAIEAWNNSSNRKRSRVDSATECSTKKRRRKPDWTRVYLGPAREADGACDNLCSACWQCYKRDVKNEFFKP